MSARKELPSAQALWSILWRAVLFFPLGVVLLFVPFLCPFAVVYLLLSAYLFWLQAEWLLMIGCLAALPITIFLWRVFARWYFSAEDQNRQLDGHSRV
ncbi:MAG: hypothetical protein ACO1QR_13395 [Chthoniobacteraceae bacterium]